MLHVDNFCDNLHECFHLVFNALCNKGVAHKNIRTIASNSVMGDRVSEIFANLLSQMFIFGSDCRTFVSYHLCSYSKGVASLGWDDPETIARLTELLKAFGFDPRRLRQQEIRRESPEAFDDGIRAFARQVRRLGKAFAGQ